MELYLDKVHNNRIAEAIAEFDLIEKDDKILVGLSGGKDSSFLLYALKVLSLNSALNFKLNAVTVDLGFSESNHLPYLKNLCDKLEVNLDVIETEIYKYIMAEKSNNPCSKCAHFKKGAIVDYMKKNGFEKLAFGHHYDDAVETFLMSILYSGQVNTLQPKRYLSDNKVYIIRPLIYLREKRIRAAKNRIKYDVNFVKCPYDKNTKREEIKTILDKLKFNKQIFHNIAAAMREDSIKEMWPVKMKQEILTEEIYSIWKD
ncbi:MAG TPA: tRNA 2-thiocytidine biosynthesis TtcA family protein [Halanaerobiales bacterium]|nr:tRNA 2-thiocytidine biosynthesis TtcA family protein [Halanaerobiales bacterium]